MNTSSRCAVLLSLALSAAPAAGSPNDPPPGASTQQRAAPGDLGMAIMSAVVFEDATLARGEGVVSVVSRGVGYYEVEFGRDVTACAYVPSVGGAAFNSQAGTATATKRVGNPKALFVETYNTAGGLTNRDFHVIVYCGR